MQRTVLDSVFPRLVLASQSLKQQRLRDAAAASSKPAVPLAKGKRKK